MIPWVHCMVTWALVGLIWTIQVVHYPMLGDHGEFFEQAHKRHMERITWLVGPLMCVELVTAVWLLLEPPPGMTWVVPGVGLGLLVLVWGWTAGSMVPLHRRLSQGRDRDALASLVRSNWVRTMAWTLRGLLAGWLVFPG